MQFVGLKIAGFKSFVDLVEVPIEPGLTGVVGPNGCGKSNLLEALRWVMGATSARAMRGGEMDDLIFSGSEGRPAREHAEVSLLLDNSQRTAPAELNDADEIEVRRTLRRGAGSTYRINGRTVRAKDVQLLFADASTGSNSPALVRQGQISELIGAKPENRRRILEEAAGIGGLAARRHEAELKLQAAETNLGQLNEIMAEIEKQSASLKRQAARAVRYRALSGEISLLETRIWAARWRNSAEETENARLSLERARNEEAEAIEKLARASTVELNARNHIAPLRDQEADAAGYLGGLRLRLARLEVERDAAGGMLIRLEADVNRLAAELTRLQSERDAARDRVEEARRELEKLPADNPDAVSAALLAAMSRTEAAAAALNEAELAVNARRSEAAAARAVATAARQSAAREQARATKLAQDILRLEAELQSLGSSHLLSEALRKAETASRTAEARLEQLQRDSDECAASARSAKAAEDELTPRLDAAGNRLRALEAELTGLDRLLRETDSRHGRPVMDDIETRGLERALAAALDADLEAPVDPKASVFWSEREIADGQALPEGAVALSELIVAPPALTARLRQCGLAPSEAGDRLQIMLHPGQRLVSREGDLWRWDGFVRRAEAPLQSAEKLAQRARRKEVRTELIQARREFETALEARQAQAVIRRQLEEKAGAARGALPEAARSVQTARETMLRAEQDIERLELRSGGIRDNLSRLQGERAAAEAAAEAALEAAAAEPDQDLSDQLQILEQTVRTLKVEELQATSARDNLALRQDQARLRRRTLERERDEAVSRAEEISARLTSCEADALASRRARDDAAPQLEAIAGAINMLADEIVTAERSRNAAADACAVGEATLRTAEGDVRAARDSLSRTRERLARSEANLEAAVRRETEVSQAARAAFDCSLEQLETKVRLALGAVSQEQIAIIDLSELDQALARLRREREALGAVNMEADRELEDIALRLDRQTADRDDLAGAIARLREGVHELNAEGRARLLEAFRAVNDHFRSLFTALFEGGEAELRLTDSEDPLDAGLEIYACPPGKRLGTLGLMSGGEQALTATALIFAVFLSRPAPVCVLDEVDAPLDDSNVDRFCRLLDEMRRRTRTRFVVITHNAVTMSRMDRLFGVTMQERGVSRLVSVDLEAAERLAAA
ncbi:MAG: chromosome segregation protein SMC [Alphaproteobacteria bacterium]|nr:chromosome segregation protein SMC [Alphaproteobacteria bacterium]